MNLADPKHVTLVKVLETIRPGASWSLLGDSYDGLVWRDEQQSKPTEKEISAAWGAAEVEVARMLVAGQRQQAYRDEADPLFFKEQAGELPTGSWIAKRAEIKDRLPYPD